MNTNHLANAAARAVEAAPMLTKSDVAARFKISERTLGKEMALGRIEFHRVGGQVRFTQEQIDAYLAQQQRRVS